MCVCVFLCPYNYYDIHNTSVPKIKEVHVMCICAYICIYINLFFLYVYMCMCIYIYIYKCCINILNIYEWPSAVRSLFSLQQAQDDASGATVRS